MQKVLFSLAIFSLMSCTSIPGESVRLKGGGRVALGAGLPTARIFLVSGDFFAPQYTKEILAQKRYWLEQGYKADEIACYYIPAADNSEETFKKQMGELMADLRDCYLADPKLLQKHLREVAQQNPKFIYLYVTGRGRVPLAEDRITYRDKKSEKVMKKLLSYENWSRTYSIELLGYIHNEFSMGLYDNVHKAYMFAAKYPKQADDFLFTPRGLKKTLSALPEETQKYVVLQGCHTEGFVLDPSKKGAENTLKGTKRARVLVSAQKEDPENGCSTGAEFTVFGEAFLSSIKKQPNKKITELDWKKLHLDVKSFVKEREVILGTYDELLSRPELYFN